MSLNLGHVLPMPKGEYKQDTAYNYLDIVTASEATYICCNRQGASSGVALTDSGYWQFLCKSGETPASDQ